MTMRDWLCLLIGHHWLYAGQRAGHNRWLCGRCGVVSTDKMPPAREYVPEADDG